MTWSYQYDGLGTTEQTIHVSDHGGNEIHSETRESWSADEAKQVVLDAMHDRCAELRDDLQRGGGQAPIDIGKITAYLTIVEDMAGEQIERAE